MAGHLTCSSTLHKRQKHAIHAPLLHHDVGALTAWEATWKPLHPKVGWPESRAGHHGGNHALVLPGRDGGRRHALQGQAALLQGRRQDDCIVGLRLVLRSCRRQSCPACTCGTATRQPR